MTEKAFRRLSESVPPHEAWEAQMGYVLERVDTLSDQVQALDRNMAAAVSTGVQAGIRALATDPDFGEAFWRSGFERMAIHASKAGSQWIGSRILTALVLAIMSACIAWLVKTGKI